MKFLLILLCLPVLCSATRHYNILAPGVDNWFQKHNFNERYGVKPGDTVVLSGRYGDIDFGKIDSVTFINEGPVWLRSMTWYRNWGGHSISVLGNGTPGLKYGITIEGTRFAINYSLTGTSEFCNLRIINNAVGFKIVGDTLTKYDYPFVKLNIHDNYISGCSLEAMYIGSDQSVGPFIYWDIQRNRIDSAGWDAIQCRVGQGTIAWNVCTRIGLLNVTGQNHGILVGSNTKSSTIRNNIVMGVAGYAIFNNGFGEQVITCNTIESNIMVQNLSYRTDFQKVGYQHFDIAGNVFLRKETTALFAYYNNPLPIKVDYYNNQVSGGVNVQKGVVFTEYLNGPARPAICRGIREHIATLYIYSDSTYELINQN